MRVFLIIFGVFALVSSACSKQVAVSSPKKSSTNSETVQKGTNLEDVKSDEWLNNFEGIEVADDFNTKGMGLLFAVNHVSPPGGMSRKLARVCNVNYTATKSLITNCEEKQYPICAALDQQVQLYGGAFKRQDKPATSPHIFAKPHPDHTDLSKFGFDFEWREVDARTLASNIRFLTISPSIEDRDRRNEYWKKTGPIVKKILLEQPEILGFQKTVIPPKKFGNKAEITLYRWRKWSKQTRNLTGKTVPSRRLYFINWDQEGSYNDVRRRAIKAISRDYSSLMVFDGRVYLEHPIHSKTIIMDTGAGLVNTGGLSGWPKCIVEWSEE